MKTQITNRMIHRSLIILMMLLGFSGLTHAQDDRWPRTLQLNDGELTIYPLQVESMQGEVVQFRAAISYLQKGAVDPVFGAGWFESIVEIDRSRGNVHPKSFWVSDTRFPDGSNEIQAELDQVLALQAPTWDLDFPLDELLASLDTAEQERKSVQDLNTAPPVIVYRDHPALLLNIDGKPILREIENSPYQTVINTPYPLIFDGNVYHLNAAKGVWYRADRATGPYYFDVRPPADLVAMVEAAAEQEEQVSSTEVVSAANAPEIVVATVPTELIVTNGPAAFVPLVDDLLVLSNSDDDVFMHISTQQYYIVLAGRWYHAGSLNGPWTYEAANELPPAFASIPENSQQADSRVYVAGTDEARQAVKDAQVPKTAAVSRGVVDIEVSYDGEPEFEPVDGTQMNYADNTSSTVLQSDRLYYLVEDGVWYVSYSANGPWEVSDYRPEEVAAISPQSPVYNVKYVYVYDSTPEVVYVGYTPGYTGSYVYYNTIVYGTGWYYRPWVSPYYYYPRYSTWGFSVGYNPWTGWNFGLSWGWGPFYAGYYSGGYWNNWNCGPWGPRGYRPRPVPYGGYDHGGRHHGGDRYARNGHDGGNGRGSYDNGRGDGGGRGGNGGNGRGGDHRGGSQAYVRNDNLYRDRGQRASVVEPAESRQTRNRSAAINTVARGNGRAVAGQNVSAKNRSRTGPVNSSDLRVKAQMRDAGLSSNESRRLASADRGNSRSSRSSTDLLANNRTATAPEDSRQRGRSSATASRNRSNPVQASGQSPTRSESREARSRASASSQSGRYQTPVTRNQQTVASQARKSETRSAAPSVSREPARQAQTTRQPRTQTRAAQAPTVRQTTTQNRTVTQKSASQRSAPVRSVQQAQAQTRVAQTPRVQSRPAQRPAVQQQSASPRSAPSRNVAQVSAAPRSSQSRPAPTRSAPQRSSAPAKSAPRSAPARSSSGRGGDGGSRSRASRADRGN